MTEQKSTHEVAEKRTLEWQLDQLRQLVETAFVKKAKEVKGTFTTGDYVTWLLNEIFTPARWSFTILQGPEMVNLSDKSAYAQVVGRLEVTFSDGSEAHQDDIGIWPLWATNVRNGGTLENTAPERYETVCKAARTDCLKNAAYNLGTCFAPLSDGALVGYLQREAARSKVAHLSEGEAAGESADMLFGVAEARSNGTTPVDASATSSEGKSGSWPTRPWDAETLGRAMVAKVAAYKGKSQEPSDDQLDYTRSSLGKLKLDDPERHTLTLYLFGKESTGDLTAAECSAVIDWIGAKPENDYEPSQDARVEARVVIKQYQIEQGQQEMAL